MSLLVGTRDGLRGAGGDELGLGGRSITALAGQADDPWIVVDGRQVWHLENGSIELVADASGGPALTCVLRTPSGVLVGTDEAHLRRLDGTTLVPDEGFDEAEGRDAWFTPWGGPPATRSLAVDDQGRVFANVHVGGMLRSTDGAESWQPTTLDIGTDAHQVIAPAGHDGLVLGAAAVGLAISHDAGDSWDLDDRGLHATYARAVALSESAILLSVSRGPGGQDAAIYRRPLDGGEPFERCVDGLPDRFDGNIDTFMLVADGPSVTLASPDGALYRSDDSGETWERTVTGLPEVRALLV